jgi:hypothetical protein
MSDLPVHTETTAPPPTVTFTAGRPRALLSGVVFRWSGQCALCRRMASLYAEGGEILIEIQASNNGKTVRWLREDRAKRPAIPPGCPLCGRERWRFTGSFEKPNDYSPAYVGNAVSQAIQTVYDTLRADYPQLAAKGDEALQAGKAFYRTTVIR